MKKKMYYTCMVMWVMCMLISCKNDDASPAPQWLTNVERDGEKILGLQYDADKKLVRMNRFGNGVLTYYTLHEYNNQGIQESRRYDGGDGDLENRVVYTLSNGLVTKAEYYYPESGFNEVGSTYIISYNASENLKSIEFNPGKPNHFIKEFTYDAARNLIKAKRTYDPNQPTEHIDYTIDYTPGQKSLPDHWNEYLTILAVSGLDEILWDVFYISKRKTFFDDEGEVMEDYLTETSNQQFDANGYLTQQTLTMTSLAGISSPYVDAMLYQFIE